MARPPFVGDELCHMFLLSTRDPSQNDASFVGARRSQPFHLHQASGGFHDLLEDLLGGGVFAFPSSLLVPPGNLSFTRVIPFRGKTTGWSSSRSGVFDVGWHDVLSSMFGSDRLGVLPKHGYAWRRRLSGCDGDSRGRLHSPLPVDPFCSQPCLPVSIDSMGIALDSSASTGDLDGASTMDRSRVIEPECLPFSPRCLESTSTGDSFDSLL